MLTLRSLLRPTRHRPRSLRHPCGIYDPEQARIEAESCLRIIEKHDASDDKLFRARCVHVKEERAELVKHHLDVLWHDYFKPEHLEKHPGIHETFWKAAKQAIQGEAVDGCRCGQGAAADDRLGRRDVEGDRRSGEDARQRTPGLTFRGPMAAERGPRRALFLVLGTLAAVGAAAVAGGRWFDLVEVRGRSMAPALLPGDRLLVERLTYRRRGPRAGEIVLAADPRQPSRELVKRIGLVDPPRAAPSWLVTHREASTDSRAFGPVDLADLRWRVVVRCWPPGRIGLVR